MIKTIEEIRTYATVGPNIYFENLEPYFKTTEQHKLINLIGAEEIKVLKNYSGDDEIINKVKSDLKGFIVNHGLLSAQPYLQNQIGNNGMTPDADRKWWQEKDLQRHLLKTATDFLNSALIEMYRSLDLFPSFRNSKEFSGNKLIIKSAVDFCEFHALNNSYLTFQTLIPTIKYVQDALFVNKDMRGFKNWILNPETDKQKEAVEIVKAIIVHKVVSEIITSNAYYFDGVGFGYKIEVLPWEKNETPDIKKLEKIIENQAEKVNVYNVLFWDFIKQNRSEFMAEETKYPSAFFTTGSSFNLV